MPFYDMLYAQFTWVKFTLQDVFVHNWILCDRVLFCYRASVIFLSNKSESALLSRKTPIMNHSHQNNTVQKHYNNTKLQMHGWGIEAYICQWIGTWYSDNHIIRWNDASKCMYHFNVSILFKFSHFAIRILSSITKYCCCHSRVGCSQLSKPGTWEGNYNLDSMSQKKCAWLWNHNNNTR